MAAMKTPAPHYGKEISQRDDLPWWRSEGRQESQKKTKTYLGRRALAAETLDLAVRVDLVVLEDGQLGLLALVLDLLGSGVDLLLALLGHATTQAED